jgi:hypothetical protein
LCILLVNQDAGVAPQAMAEVTPTHLSTGHGDNACHFLNLIADRAILKHCKKQAMVYPSDVEAGDTGASEFNDDDEDDDGIVEV